MANPTTNYGFVLPTSTDLVTDLPADFDVALQGVDTRLKALQPGTTLGDLAYSSATANTNTRLGIGTTGQILTVSGGVPAWATVSSGGMTLLSTTTLSGATTTISSISQDYNELFIYVNGQTNNTANGFLRCNINGVNNTLVRVDSYYVSSPESAGTTGASGSTIFFGASQTYDRLSANNAGCLRLPNYSSTTSMKPYHATGGYYGSGAGYNGYNVAGLFYDTTAISSLVFSNSGGNHSAGTVKIYGVK